MESSGQPNENAGKWQLTMLVLVFLATLIPYLILLLLVNPLDLVSFVIGWWSFFALRAKLSKDSSFLAPLVSSLVLAFPVSALYTAFAYSALALELDHAIPRLAYFLALMIAAHHLSAGVRWVRP